MRIDRHPTTYGSNISELPGADQQEMIEARPATGSFSLDELVDMRELGRGVVQQVMYARAR